MSGIAKQAKKVLHPDIVGEIGKTGENLWSQGKYRFQSIVSNGIHKKANITSVSEAEEAMGIEPKNRDGIEGIVGGK